MANERVLVVEDTELLRRIYTDRLAQDGYTVFGAGDGLEALSTLRDTPVDLILLDLIMPRMGGLEVLEAVKSDPRTKDIPVVVLTNLGEEDTIERAVALGAVDYLIKNEARPADVSDKIRLALDAFSGGGAASGGFAVYLQDKRGSADALIEHAGLRRRFWCPACEEELVLELVPKTDRPGWYDAHFVCGRCGKEY